MSNDNTNGNDQIADFAYPAVSGDSTAASPAKQNDDVPVQDLTGLSNISSITDSDNTVVLDSAPSDPDTDTVDNSPAPVEAVDPGKQKPADLEAQLSNLSGLGTPQAEEKKDENKKGVTDLSDVSNESDDAKAPTTIGEGKVEEGGDSKKNPLKSLASKLTTMKEDLIEPTTEAPEKKDKKKEDKTKQEETPNPDAPMDVTLDDDAQEKAESKDAAPKVEEKPEGKPDMASQPTKGGDISVMFEDKVPQKGESMPPIPAASNMPSQPPAEAKDASRNDPLPKPQPEVASPAPAPQSDPPVKPEAMDPKTDQTSSMDTKSDSADIKPPASDPAPKPAEVPPTTPAPQPVAADPMGLNTQDQPIVQKDPDNMMEPKPEPVTSQTPASTPPIDPAPKPVVPDTTTQASEPTEAAPPPPPPFTPPPKAPEKINPVKETVTPDLAPEPEQKSQFDKKEEGKKTSHSRYPYTIEQLLDIVVERDASDLHITVDYPAMIRVDGSLVNVIEELVTPQQAQDLILPVLPEQKKELLDVNREVDLAHPHRADARFRINAYYQKQTLAAAFRLIPNTIRSIDELKLPQIYHKLTKLKQGLVLVTGPTGSGKSTTLAAILQEINENRADHIITIEDPVEYVLPRARAMVDQRELHEDTHSWEIAMRSALRQDPDVILVGEMRDYETIASAITLAETGHLVFATLHTNSAAQTLDRIVDVFPEHQQAQIRSQLSNTIEAVIAQRLIPLQRGGRTAVSEIMIATPAIRNLIREAKTHQIDNVIRTSADIGMISLEHTLVKMVRENTITMERAMEFAVHPEEVVRLLKS